MRRSPGLLALACLATPALVGCGGSSGSVAFTTSPRILDTRKIERTIERAALSQRATRVVVRCPSGVRQERGLAFSCTARAKRAVTRFLVTELDAAGHVRFEAR